MQTNANNAHHQMNSTFIPPKLICYRYDSESMTITYSRFGEQKALLLMPDDLAKYLHELTAIEGYDAEGPEVMVLHTVMMTAVNSSGELYPHKQWDGERLSHWMQREFTDTIAQAIINLHEHRKDTAMMRSHLHTTLDFIAQKLKP